MITIEGNLNAEDSKRILSLMDRPVLPWQEVMRKGGKTPRRVFAVDTTRVLCGSGGTRVVSKVIALSTVWVSSDGHDYEEISARSQPPPSGRLLTEASSATGCSGGAS